MPDSTSCYNFYFNSKRKKKFIFLLPHSRHYFPFFMTPTTDSTYFFFPLSLTPHAQNSRHPLHAIREKKILRILVREITQRVLFLLLGSCFGCSQYFARELERKVFELILFASCDCMCLMEKATGCSPTEFHPLTTYKNEINDARGGDSVGLEEWSENIIRREQ